MSNHRRDEASINNKLQIFDRNRAGRKVVDIESGAITQAVQTASLPCVRKVAIMPDAHIGIGATVGSVIGTVKAVIPAAVGVDIGCGMTAANTNLTATDLPDSLSPLRGSIERNVPHGRTGGGRRKRDRGAWSNSIPSMVAEKWMNDLEPEFKFLLERHRDLEKANHATHLGTLGSGNHFIELCIDEVNRVWVMLHSGSRGIGNRIGRKFIELAREDMRCHQMNLPNVDLAYLSEGTHHFKDYMLAVEWAQKFAFCNREVMMTRTVDAIRQHIPHVRVVDQVIECHHNYVARETHGRESLFVTRKGAVRANQGDLGIIPGSMGAKSYIVRGKGNADSLRSCSHGAGRAMSRTEARKAFTSDDLREQTAGIECRKDSSVVDEIPAAYKDIDAVMEAQQDLVEVVHTLKQVICVKG